MRHHWGKWWLDCMCPIMCCTWPTIYVSIRWSFTSISVQYLKQVVHKLFFFILVYLEPNLCINHVSSYLFHYSYLCCELCINLCILCCVPTFLACHQLKKKINFFSIKLLPELLDMHELSQKIFLNSSTLDVEYSQMCSTSIPTCSSLMHSFNTCIIWYFGNIVHKCR